MNILAPIARGDKNLPEKEQTKNYCVERINLKDLSLSNSDKFGLKLLQWLTFSIIASFRIAKSHIKSGPIIQYQSTYSAIPAILVKIVLRAKIIGDDILLIHPLIDTLALKLTDAVVTASMKTYSFAKRLGRLTIYVPNGVEHELYKRPASKVKPRFLFVGALSFDQNLNAVENIVKIASDLEEKGLMFDVVIVGGPLSYAQHLIKHPIVKTGKVKFVGIASDDKLAEFYDSSFIGLLPFFQDSPLTGGQRTKALEFFVHHLLVISGPEGVKGIFGLKRGKHYLLASSLDEMSTILARCLADPMKYRDIADIGATYISENYSWDVVTKEYISLIQSSAFAKATTIQ